MIYCSLRENTYYDSDASVLDYKIVDDNDNVIYYGHSIKNPKTGLNRINITEIVRDYLSNGLKDDWAELTEESGITIMQKNALRVFTLILGSLIIDKYCFLCDYSDFFTGDSMELSMPINEKADPRQKIFFSEYQEPDYYYEYFTTRALGEGVITVKPMQGSPQNVGVKLGYSVNGGEWKTGNTVSGFTVSVSNYDEVRWKKMSGLVIVPYGDMWEQSFSATCPYEVFGNICSLSDGVYDDEGTADYAYFVANSGNCSFAGLFHNSKTLVNARDLVLPSTNVTYGCYRNMFDGCTNLINAPKYLPGVSAGTGVYLNMFSGCVKLVNAPKIVSLEIVKEADFRNMFKGCVSLKNAPVFYATELGENSMNALYSGCTSLESVPDLRVTKLERGSCANMFAGCSSLTTAPSLPATDLSVTWYTGEGYGIGVYDSMFKGCTSLKIAPELPATKLSTGCYHSMFEGCSNLIQAPVLPATSFKATDSGTGPMNGVYESMFKNCTSLVTAPQLPNTDLSNHILYGRNTYNCYKSMFEGCASLKNAPNLPAKYITIQSAYSAMFKNCTSLVNAPEILAESIGLGVCEQMFLGCSSLKNVPDLHITNFLTNQPNMYHCHYMFAYCGSLENAPKLPATAVTTYCYQHMFYGSNNLKKITCMAKVIKDEYGTISDFDSYDCCQNWVNDNNLSDTGIFIKKRGVTGWGYGNDGIPTGWTVEEVD